jgi:two-component system, response regulator YesN
MYHLLIVDDEYLFIEGLKADIDKNKLGISEISIANNIRQAKDIIENHKIDVILCDIEMPQGTGLDLLRWIKDHHLKIECVFLTSHAKFNYAKEAIQLGSVDYLLKPVEVEDLEKVLFKAMDQISLSKEMEQLSNYKKLWNQHHPLIIELFWLDIINYSIPNKLNTIKETASKRNINLSEEIVFLPILIGVQRWHGEHNLHDRKMLESALRKSAEELIIETDDNGSFIYLDHTLSLVILTLESDQLVNYDSLKINCEQYIESCNHRYDCDLSCYVGDITSVEDMHDEVKRLKGLEKNNVAFDNKVFFLRQSQEMSSQVKMPDMTAWITMLKNGTNEPVKNEIETFLHEMEGSNANFLNQFHQNFLQMVFFVLNLKGIQAHRLFSDSKSIEFSEKATRSIKEMIDWVHYVIEKATEQTEKVEEVNTIVNTIKNYIAIHIDNNELSRKDIAKHVFLNEDYLSRLFKKEVGIPLSNYIIEERINLAKDLLRRTDLSISDVASSVGYSNFSHFTKVFKKLIGANPKDFRNNYFSKTMT